MAAATSPLEHREPEPAPPVRLVTSAPDADAAQRAVEHRMLRAALVGMAVGAIVCVVLWDLMLLIALAGSGEPLGPPLLMGVVVGVFAGVFIGGWAGTLYGAHLLEEHERETRPPAPMG